ncbi:unnamed protein product [Adineta ricciae]|uniref:RING-type domain-containing protein n=1 Tax=Adineta ricciae TaxID=249248 RepID=A0A814E9J9_ADIRI|nr:unnamed protein product [Adineta ricciae]
MAIGVRSRNHTVSSNTSMQAALRQKRRIKPDLCRLASFRQWKSNTQCNISAALLSKVGFSYTGQGDKVRCEACKLEIDSWKPGMDPRQEHMERSPQCPFVLEQSELFSKQDQAVSILKSPIARTNVSRTDYRGYMDDGGGSQNLHRDSDQPTIENLFIISLSTEIVDRARAYTFLNWPSITPSAQEMAYAGWWYTNITDRVICIHCDAMFHNWSETDRPYEVHRLRSPRCYYIRMNESKQPTSNLPPIPVANQTINDTPNGQSIVGAIHAEYALVVRRHQTFDKWPGNGDTPLPSIESFVDAGFFYTGDKTIVRCFYCNGALRNWQASDDPKVEHARWFPQCAYIRQYIGENLYQAIQRKNREIRAQQNLQMSNSGASSQYIPWTNDEIDRMVKARLDLPVVEKLRQENYSMAIIRKVFEMQLRFKKDDFKTDVDLRVACLILDKQVKLINGNEGNILVAQHWVKKYYEDQEKGIPTPQIESKPMSIEPMKTDIPKTTPKVAAHSLTTTKTEESLCVLCMSTDRQVACLPCGHLTSCVACGHSLKTCPICRTAVKAFVRIYT